MWNRCCFGLTGTENVETNTTNETNTNDSKEQTPVVMRLSTATPDLLRPIPYIDGTYFPDRYIHYFVNDMMHFKKFAVAHLLGNLIWEHESNETIFSIRDGCLAKITDFACADEHLLCEFAMSVIIWKWPLLWKALLESHPWIYDRVKPFVQLAVTIGKRNSLLSVFQSEIEMGRRESIKNIPPIIPSAPLSPISPMHITPSITEILTPPPPPYVPEFDEMDTVIHAVVTQPPLEKELQETARELFRQSIEDMRESSQIYEEKPRPVENIEVKPANEGKKIKSKNVPEIILCL